VDRVVKQALAADRTGNIRGMLRAMGWSGSGSGGKGAGGGFKSAGQWAAFQARVWEGAVGLGAGGRDDGHSDGDGDSDGDVDDDELSNGGSDAFETVLQLITVIYRVSQQHRHEVEPNSGAAAAAVAGEAAVPTQALPPPPPGQPPQLRVSQADFVSHKLNAKLRQQMADPLVLASDALPGWCEELTTSCR
jgi:hypothetical protein